jgi:hypothetical protein
VINCAIVLEWERCFPGRKLDKDSPEDMQWVFERYFAVLCAINLHCFS